METYALIFYLSLTQWFNFIEACRTQAIFIIETAVDVRYLGHVVDRPGCPGMTLRTPHFYKKMFYHTTEASNRTHENIQARVWVMCPWRKSYKREYDTNSEILLGIKKPWAYCKGRNRWTTTFIFENLSADFLFKIQQFNISLWQKGLAKDVYSCIRDHRHKD